MSALGQPASQLAKAPQNQLTLHLLTCGACPRPLLCRLCSFAALQPVILPLLQRQRCSALFIGSGLSTFPEDVYNRYKTCISLPTAQTPSQ